MRRRIVWRFCWHMEHYLIATMMLVVGLFTVLSWDAAFPDRRDVMVLSPLPVAPHTILFAKVSASAAVIGDRDSYAELRVRAVASLAARWGLAGPRFGILSSASGVVVSR